MTQDYDKNDLNVAYQLGEINNTLKDLTSKIKTQNGRITTLEGKDRKMEVLFSKIGGVTITIGFIVATVFNFVIEWFKTHFMK